MLSFPCQLWLLRALYVNVYNLRILVFALSTPVTSCVSLFILSCSFSPGFAQVPRPLSLLKVSYMMETYSSVASDFCGAGSWVAAGGSASFPSVALPCLSVSSCFLIWLLMVWEPPSPACPPPPSSRKMSRVCAWHMGPHPTPPSSLQPLFQPVPPPLAAAASWPRATTCSPLCLLSPVRASLPGKEGLPHLSALKTDSSWGLVSSRLSASHLGIKGHSVSVGTCHIKRYGEMRIIQKLKDVSIPPPRKQKHYDTASHWMEQKLARNLPPSPLVSEYWHEWKRSGRSWSRQHAPRYLFLP